MSYRPAPIKRESVITRAAQEICRYIADEKLKPGETLPTETHFSRLFGVSRNSIREALRVVHGLGMIDKPAGRRVVVTAATKGGRGIFDESVIVEAAPLANMVRSQIAQKCAELAAERLTNEELRQLDDAFQTLERAILKHDAAAAQSAHDSFHGLLLAGGRNPLLVAMFNQAQLARLANVSSAAQQSYADTVHLEHHRALLRALHDRDAEAARSAVQEHFESLGLMLGVMTKPRGVPLKPAAKKEISRNANRQSKTKKE
ncbi:FadR/GntR family transcriptional regulator [Rhodoplanes sp. Z2-YC6860]|uniref:FadR/GntR family transcriptional regulator n=1 Tax=Rhodoplanes sp. Z2-YC6860 TaxID=674703 RepID=UPI00078BB8FA|nr:FCD domain-containing protein [Rhodoplanes sp. Z2-YC6860]AMN41685.1 transcriptional regulator, GntR-family [Rhodoplanes sp. Z2-YC6860]